MRPARIRHDAFRVVLGTAILRVLDAGRVAHVRGVVGGRPEAEQVAAEPIRGADVVHGRLIGVVEFGQVLFGRGVAGELGAVVVDVLVAVEALVLVDHAEDVAELVCDVEDVPGEVVAGVVVDGHEVAAGLEGPDGRDVAAGGEAVVYGRVFVDKRSRESTQGFEGLSLVPN